MHNSKASQFIRHRYKLERELLDDVDLNIQAPSYIIDSMARADWIRWMEEHKKSEQAAKSAHEAWRKYVIDRWLARQINRIESEMKAASSAKSTRGRL